MSTPFPASPGLAQSPALVVASRGPEQSVGVSEAISARDELASTARLLRRFSAGQDFIPRVFRAIPARSCTRMGAEQEDRTLMNGESDGYQAYLVRLWRVRSQAGWQWRASLESPHTGERQVFADLVQLFAFLSERCREQDAETRGNTDAETGRRGEEET